jgi:hypothetical protein
LSGLAILRDSIRRDSQKWNYGIALRHQTAVAVAASIEIDHGSNPPIFELAVERT